MSPTKNGSPGPDDKDDDVQEAKAPWPQLMEALVAGKDLSRQQASEAMLDILGGLASPARISGLLVGLRAKGETVDELTGFASAMLDTAEPLRVDAGAIDIVGTGGSGHRRLYALNVSTMASIVAAAAGATVCKHGNRRASSTSGSFDFLEALGIAIDLSPSQLEHCVAEVGLGFAFARTFHPAMRFAGPVRADLGIPTVFNLLGPLAHPGRLTRQLIGVPSVPQAEMMAHTLKELGSDSAWVVSGAGGLDELNGDSTVFEVSAAGVERQQVLLADLGLSSAEPTDLAGGSPEDNARIFEAILAGQAGARRDIVALNAAAGLVVAGLATTLRDGLERVTMAIDDGSAAAKLDELRTMTNNLAAAG